MADERKENLTPDERKENQGNTGNQQPPSPLRKTYKNISKCAVFFVCLMLLLRIKEYIKIVAARYFLQPKSNPIPIDKKASFLVATLPKIIKILTIINNASKLQ